MTPKGHEALQQELQDLLSVQRPKVVREIEEALSHGDLSENSEYEDAKHRQGMIEGRILEVKAKIGASEIIDITKIDPSGRVIFGVTVEIEDQDTEETSSYRIVGTDEADVKKGMLSVTSPLARGLIGQEVGDEVSVTTPRGLRKFVIVDVAYR